MKCIRIAGRAVMALLLGMLSAPAAGVVFTKSADFFAALSGYELFVEDFESTPAGTLVPDGAAVGDLSFAYDFGGVRIGVTDGAKFGGSGPYTTTSGSNFLGTEDADIFLDGDDFQISFPAVNAIGLFFISADTLLDDDIRLSVGGLTASLVAADIELTLPDGSDVYFLGIEDGNRAFTTASVTTLGLGAFFYNVDDVVTAVAPDGDRVVAAPPPALLLVPGLVLLLGRIR